MHLQFDDAVPMWFDRLPQAGLLTPSIRETTEKLSAKLRSMKDKSLWEGPASLFRDDWVAVRQLAERALSEIDVILIRGVP